MSDNYVIITTLSHFKLKYAIPQKDFDALGFAEPLDREQLLKFVSSGNVNEFSQTHLGEVVADVSVHTEDDTITIFDYDNSYVSSWTKDKKLQCLKDWDLSVRETSVQK